jgi:hypothetical protein
MKVVIAMELDHPPTGEILFCLHGVATQIDLAPAETMGTGPVTDSNGDTVGLWAISDE